MTGVICLGSHATKEADVTGNLLLRGMIAGALAGLAVFVFAFLFGEPLVDRAIGFEEALSQAAGAVPEPELVSRTVQAGVGLFTGVMGYSIALGGLFALVFALVQGRFSTLSPRATAYFIALAALVAIVVVPSVKYPANPPAVGNAETIGIRTQLYFLMIVVSLTSLVVAVALARRWKSVLGAWRASIVSGALYVAFIGTVVYLLPPINEVPESFPADVLWKFRSTSISMHAVLWFVLASGFVLLINRSAYRQRFSRRPLSR